MSAFSLDCDYHQFNFDHISVDDLQVISGGSGGFSSGRLNEPWGSGVGSVGGGFPHFFNNYYDMSIYLSTIGNGSMV